MRSSAAATVTSLEPWPSATSKRRPRAQRVSSAERSKKPSAFADSLPPRWRPMASCAIPKRSHSASVCAKSRAVTSTSQPRARRTSITGRMTSTCGEFVRSIQARICAGQASGADGASGYAVPPAGTLPPAMFTSQSLRAVQPSGSPDVRGRRLDDVLEQLEVRGPFEASGVGEVARRIDAALADGVRWLVVDLSDAVAGPEALRALAGTLVETARH